METILRIRGLTVTFPTQQGPFQALRNVDIDLHKGEKIALMGESGCGKSVLGHAIMGLLDDISKVEGEIIFNGKDINKCDRERKRELRGRRIALVPQNPSNSFNPVIKVGKQIDEMSLYDGNRKKNETRSCTLDRLQDLGFSSPDMIYSSYPHQLSGGMCERALICMGTALAPDIIIADEPTKGLDPVSKSKVLDLLVRSSQGKTLLMITHDYYASMVCDRVAVMYSGQIVEDGPAQLALNNPSHPYSKGLWASLPSNGMVPIPRSLRKKIDGGCVFADRCTSYSFDCDFPPRLLPITEGHFVRCCHV